MESEEEDGASALGEQGAGGGDGLGRVGNFGVGKDFEEMGGGVEGSGVGGIAEGDDEGIEGGGVAGVGGSSGIEGGEGLIKGEGRGDDPASELAARVEEFNGDAEGLMGIGRLLEEPACVDGEGFILGDGMTTEPGLGEEDGGVDGANGLVEQLPGDFGGGGIGIDPDPRVVAERLGFIGRGNVEGGGPSEVFVHGVAGAEEGAPVEVGGRLEGGGGLEGKGRDGLNGLSGSLGEAASGFAGGVAMVEGSEGGGGECRGVEEGGGEASAEEDGLTGGDGLGEPLPGGGVKLRGVSYDEDSIVEGWMVRGQGKVGGGEGGGGGGGGVEEGGTGAGGGRGVGQEGGDTREEFGFEPMGGFATASGGEGEKQAAE